MTSYKGTKLWGSDNPNWKGGKPSCADCGLLLRCYGSKRCISCLGKSKIGKRRISDIKKSVAISSIEATIARGDSMMFKDAQQTQYLRAIALSLLALLEKI